jgi:hypothetical protein
MGDYSRRLNRVLDLEPGERILAGARGMTKGATKGIVGGAAGAGFGASGIAVGSRAGAEDRAAAADEHEAAGLPRLPTQVAVGLTDRRLILIRRSPITGRPTHVIASVPRSRIEAITGDTPLSAFKPDRLAVALDDGTRLTFEIVRRDGQAGIVEAFAQE